MSTPLKGKQALITAGPTYEAIDPVRFIGNHSTGKMGYALAKALQKAGADVTLISGPSSLPDPENITTIRVKSSDEMYEAASSYFPTAEITILAAAVADYKPKHAAPEKIKKAGESMTLELVKTVDIAMTLGKIKKDSQLLIGFALETTNEEAHAREKLKKKNFDFIVLNSLKNPGSGFGHDTNQISIIDNNNIFNFELKHKEKVAQDIVDFLIKKKY